MGRACLQNDIDAMLLKYHLRWAGHDFRMTWHRLSKIALYCESSSGNSERGVPSKHHKGCLKKFLSACHVDHLGLSHLSKDRGARRHVILKTDNESYEDRRVTHKETSEAEGKLELPLTPRR